VQLLLPHFHDRGCLKGWRLTRERICLRCNVSYVLLAGEALTIVAVAIGLGYWLGSSLWCWLGLGFRLSGTRILGAAIIYQTLR
jgi:hypothetical protein